MSIDDLRTMTVDDVAELLHVRPEAVRIWIRTGRLRACKWGRRLHVRPEDVKAFQDGREVKVPDPAEFVRRMRAERLAGRRPPRGQAPRK
jgi:excisionase family DNA binding protein